MRVPKSQEAAILAAFAQQHDPGTKPKRTRKPRTVAVAHALPLWSVVLRPACRVVTEANTTEHWHFAYKRKVAQNAAVHAAWLSSPMFGGVAQLWLPLTVTLEHVGPRMDDDNLARAFKAVRDKLAALIGVDDGDVRLKWVYQQRTGDKGIVITIEPGVSA